MARGIRNRIALSVAAGAAALAVYIFGFVAGPAVDGPAQTRRAYLEGIVAGGMIDLAREATLAEDYWRHYADVASDPFFGRSGPMGALGAREHYERHGRREGRIWPEPAQPVP